MVFKAVLFDLDGTIRHNLPSGGEFFAAYARQLGLHITDEDRLRALRWEHFYWAESDELKQDRLTYPDGADFWFHYAWRQLIALGASVQQALEYTERVTKYMEQAYKPQSVVPEDARRLLITLKAEGFKLAVVSNRQKSYQEEMEELGLADFFAFAMAGGEIKALKPEPEIFYEACRRLDVSPAEAVYIGDNYFADVVGARRAGIEPVLYDPRGVFPDPGCAIIKSFDQLPAFLKTNFDNLRSSR